MWALLRRPPPGDTSYRSRSRCSREAKADRQEGGPRHRGVLREPRDPRQGIGRSSQIRDSDHCSSLRLLLGRGALASMVRPTRSDVVTGVHISAAHPGLESAEKEISCRLICRQAAVCIPQGTVFVTNAGAIPKVAGQGCAALRKLPDVDARFIGNLRHRLACSRIRRFPRDFCSAASRKGAPL